jgi:hypothetical protein
MVLGALCVPSCPPQDLGEVRRDQSFGEWYSKVLRVGYNPVFCIWVEPLAVSLEDSMGSFCGYGSKGLPGDCVY